MTALASLLGPLLLAGCAPDGAAGDAAARRALEPAAQRSVGATPGKPQAPIDFDYELLGTPALGQPLPIRIRSALSPPLDGLDVVLRADQGLLVPAALARFRLARAADGDPAERTISVTPLTAGTHYLNLLLAAELGGRRQARSVTIRIAVGGVSAAAKPAGPVAEDASGQRIISLPARRN